MIKETFFCGFDFRGHATAPFYLEVVVDVSCVVVVVVSFPVLLFIHGLGPGGRIFIGRVGSDHGQEHYRDFLVSVKEYIVVVVHRRSSHLVYITTRSKYIM